LFHALTQDLLDNEYVAEPVDVVKEKEPIAWAAGGVA